MSGGQKGMVGGRVIHGLTRTKEWRAWTGMKNRVNDPVKAGSYHDVTIHPPWLASFLAFLGHVGLAPTPAHTLDRIDPFGNYEPGNVRWATWEEQRRNRRQPIDICKRGHPLTGPVADVYINRTTGARQCLPCVRERKEGMR